MAHGQGNMASRLSSVEASGCVLVCSTATRGYGATAARLTPDQKVGSSNLSALIARDLRRPATRVFAPTAAREQTGACRGARGLVAVASAQRAERRHCDPGRA